MAAKSKRPKIKGAKGKMPDDETIDGQTSNIPIDKRVGATVRKKRLALGLTLSDLSGGSQLSDSMLSRIENGQSSASLDVLERICSALGTSLAELINEIDNPQGSAQLIKPKDQLEVVRTGTRFGHNYKLLSYQRGPTQPFEPFLIEMDRESEEYPTFRHPGIEFIYMLEGCMKYKFGDKQYLIEPGRCLYIFSRSRTWTARADDREGAVYLCDLSPDINESELRFRGLIWSSLMT